MPPADCTSPPMPTSAIAHGEIIFIAVGTPPEEDGSADLSHVLDVARTIGRALTRPAIIVNKSTVPVGTADRVRDDDCRGTGRCAAVEVAFDVVSNPEFLKEGDAVQDCMRPDRIIIGSDSARAIDGPAHACTRRSTAITIASC